MKKLKFISTLLCAALCVSLFTAVSQAKTAKKYVRSLSVKSKATITIPANKKTVTKAYKVTVKVKGKVSKRFTAKSSKSTVAAVKVSGSTIKVTAKRAGTAKIKVTTKAKNRKGKKLSKTLTVTVKKQKVKKPEPEKPEDEKGMSIYFANNKSWTAVNARLLNRATGDEKTTKMTFAEKNELGEDVYTAKIDLEKYDRVVFDNGTDKTTDTPVTKASTGFYIASPGKTFNGKYLAGVYTHGKQDGGKLDTIEMSYPKGYDKTIKIYTPEGYDPEDKSKTYSVLYMADGQSLFGTSNTRSIREWRCDETVQSLINNGGDGVIIVGVVTNDDNRFSELTPKIGEISSSIPALPETMTLEGETFSNFIVNDVISYVEEHYNTNGIRGIAGSSSGGLEAFYIGMEHPDKFSYVGVISPAMDFFEDDAWNKYLSEKDFSAEMPKMYLYSGNNDRIEKIQCTATVAMESRLKDKGYPADKLTMVIDQDGAHNEGFWALYFPEMLCFGLG